MIRYLTDENIPSALADGLRDRGVDVVRVQEVGLMNTPDPDILEWAAGEERILITYDIRTMPGHAYDRVADGRPMPSVVIGWESLPVGWMIDELLIGADCGTPDDFRDLVKYLPL